MKALLLALLLTCTAQADTLTELRPAGPVTGPYRWQCAATGFVDSATVLGACQEKYYSGARYAQPKVVGTWQTTWDLQGTPRLSTTVAPWPGCVGSGSVVIVNGVPMYFITANALGWELVENYCRSFLVVP
jgi:hypothetical protein